MKQTPVRLREVFSVTKNAILAVMEGVARIAHVPSRREIYGN